MQDFLVQYWPHLTGFLAVVLGVGGAVHAIMTKSDVRAAAGWTGVIILSPILGALLYGLLGINRIRRETRLKGRQASLAAVRRTGGATAGDGPGEVPQAFSGMRRLGDAVAAFPLVPGNRIRPLEDGDTCYAAMCAAIDAARAWILLETYIFDNDRIGRKIAERLGAAVDRGVEVRVLVDAIGSHYSTPSIVQHLARLKVPHALFMDGIVGFRLTYANLRTHRKLLLVDGRVAFMGGLNIRDLFSAELQGDQAGHDVHFRVEGPVVADLGVVFAQDWDFTTGETLPVADIFAPALREPAGAAVARAVPSGPDHHFECNHGMVMGVLSVARERILLASPYFLPDRRLIAAFQTAAARGVTIDIVVPGANNLALVDCAMTAQFDQLIAAGCRIWRAAGTFDHAKLLTADGVWSYVGSSNLDPRSLRLNFEIDLEAYDPVLAGWIEGRIRGRITSARPVTAEALAARSFLQRLRDRTVWLASPYL